MILAPERNIVDADHFAAGLLDVAAGRAVRAQFDPVKLNYLTLGNTIPHLHTHVVPRYRDDPAPGGPIEWAQIFSPDPVPDVELHRQAAGLRVLLTS